ncbi:hypothetical protein [Prosthecodimorpha staleyi]|jgi:hypothetical protein|uniref:Uncharacterized protein n=1 Tax=Prosthecodimorpha staleyi TaxID=2840188 RepID=A0A947D7V9_9HYPH|nr:hypothetical protein [Prosthecodimorpha staleyi]MBT9292723.1 hypothetical protein [Prosthecodimorpha staleyi]
MAEQPDHIVIEMLKRIRASQERMELDLSDLKSRVSSLELHQGQTLAMMGGISQRLDRLDERIGRIERRLDLVDA